MLENDYRLDFIIDFKQRVPLMADDLKFTKTDDNELKQYLPHVMEYRNRYGVIADGV